MLIWLLADSRNIAKMFITATFTEVNHLLDDDVLGSSKPHAVFLQHMKFAAAGGKIYVCSPCFKKRGLDETKLVAGATIVGGAKLVEFLAGGSPCVSY